VTHVRVFKKGTHTQILFASHKAPTQKKGAHTGGAQYDAACKAYMRCICCWQLLLLKQANSSDASAWQDRALCNAARQSPSQACKHEAANMRPRIHSGVVRDAVPGRTLHQDHTLSLGT
jgi:hypothetical protein